MTFTASVVFAPFIISISTKEQLMFSQKVYSVCEYYNSSLIIDKISCVVSYFKNPPDAQCN